MPLVKAIIFDVDGVLVDSKNANAEFYGRLMKAAGYARPEREVLDGYFHLPMWQAIERLTGRADKTEIERIWKLGHDPMLYPTHLLIFPDSLHDVLAELRAKYRLAVVTGRIRQGIESAYTAADIGKFFEVAVSFEDYANPKPHPEPLHTALKRLALKPGEAVYVGDSHTDIEAAKAAGMPSIHLATKKHSDANVGVTSFKQIPVAVQKIVVMG